MSASWKCCSSIDQPPRDLGAAGRARPDGRDPRRGRAPPAARRTGVARVFLEQLYTFGDLDRDPRGAGGHGRLLRPRQAERPSPVKAATDARNAAWSRPATAARRSPSITPRISRLALERLRGKVRYQPIGFELLPPKFTLSQLQTPLRDDPRAPLDKRNFRKKVAGAGAARGAGRSRAGRRPPGGAASTASTNAVTRSWQARLQLRDSTDKRRWGRVGSGPRSRSTHGHTSTV